MKPMHKICFYLFHLFRCYLLKCANSFHGLFGRFGMDTMDNNIIMHKRKRVRERERIEKQTKSQF